MATKKSGPTESGVYRVIDVIGTSSTSWEDAAKNAVETASGSLHDLRIAEVAKLDVKIEGEKVVAFKKKRRKNTHRKRGHRQHFTTVKVLGITAG